MTLFLHVLLVMVFILAKGKDQGRALLSAGLECASHSSREDALLGALTAAGFGVVPSCGG